MKSCYLRRSGVLLLSLCFVFGNVARGDEGMWTFDNLPLAQLKERYNFTPTQEWIDHVRLSSVRFNDGGSGSFVSPNGLVLTNHHVALTQLQNISTEKKDYVRDGFYARTRAEELKSPDAELNVLVSMENVTERVHRAAAGKSDQEALAARRAEMAAIEKESKEKTGLRSEIVTLYLGGEYWLYRYKEYTDVRLVFAPEQQAAFFGGDPDNFTYPRYCMDFALFRVYENGKPAATKQYLKWNRKGAAEGDLVFVSGHPGSTERLETVAGLEAKLEHLPMQLKRLNYVLEAMRRYAALGEEQARQAAGLIFGIENSVKAISGEFTGLKDPALLAQKRKHEQELRAKVAANPEWKQWAAAWEESAAAEKRWQEIMAANTFRSLIAPATTTAVLLVRYPTEVKKPDGQRLSGFHDAQLESLRFQLLSPAPVYLPMEEALLRASLELALQELGPEDEFVKATLQGRTPAEAARQVFSNTRITDVEFRKSLMESEAAIANSDDSLIAFARRIDPVLRETRRQRESEYTSKRATAGEKIGKARFAALGKSTYPDATFTLRLTYGAVKSYPMNGTIAPTHTTFYGLYDRAHGFAQKPPFHLPPRYAQGRAKLDLATPMNFISSTDVVGGNSGSPVINRNAEVVGLVFDGNIESLVGNFVYNEENNRTIAVHSGAIIEVLRKLYAAAPLANELEGIVAKPAAASATAPAKRP